MGWANELHNLFETGKKTIEETGGKKMILVTATKKRLIGSKEKDAEVTQAIIRLLLSNGYSYHAESDF